MTKLDYDLNKSYTYTFRKTDIFSNFTGILLITISILLVLLKFKLHLNKFSFSLAHIYILFCFAYYINIDVIIGFFTTSGLLALLDLASIIVKISDNSHFIVSIILLILGCGIMIISNANNNSKSRTLISKSNIILGLFLIFLNIFLLIGYKKKY